ncbi:dehydrogenase [Halobacillus sp. Nhm2S1]|uniref:dehydrogenase n=1 Tax=Halobacillus sp. Nhm2S1 TaxID=2866716 RepID=UPI001C73CC87|nr:dehydrogenase [Halobacillus sp. Nhm2S1]MBX0359473.1 dehydrogenase [Halobacillus sp. Nhm2S1]
MSNVYHDYFKETVLTIPDSFIDIKTGDQHAVSAEIKEEIAYHSENNTLNHLIFSALNHYFHKAAVSQPEGTNGVLSELLEIKRLLAGGSYQKGNVPLSNKKTAGSQEMDLQEIEDLLEAFGG